MRSDMDKICEEYKKKIDEQKNVIDKLLKIKKVGEHKIAEFGELVNKMKKEHEE
jgi:hypothetical protein